MFTKILDWLMANADAPNFILTLLLILSLLIVWNASKKSPGRLGHIISDDRGLISSSRLAMMIALGVSSYMLVFLTVNRRVNDETLFYLYAVYLIAWASSKTLDKAVSVWGATKMGPRKWEERPEYGGSPPSYQPPSYQQPYQQPSSWGATKMGPRKWEERPEYGGSPPSYQPPSYQQPYQQPSSTTGQVPYSDMLTGNNEPVRGSERPDRP